jgi:uncharacterized protein (TIRG00374 family)
MNARQRRTVALSVLVSAVFLFLAFRNVPLADLAAALGRLHAGWLLVAVVISLLIMVFRAWRWQVELRPLERIPFGRLWVITAVAYMAINLLPVRLGEVVRPWLLSRRSSVSFSNVVGNLVVEKTMDAVVTLLYILAGLATIANLPAWVRTGARIPAVGAIILVGLVLLLYWRGEAFVDRTVLRFLPERFGAGVRRVTGAIVAGMRVLPNPRLVLTVFLLSIALWSLPILSSYVMMQAFDFELPFSAAVVVFIFIGFGTALPNVPGMLGPYQYACILALGLFGVPQADALAYGLVLNAVQFLSIIGQGLVAWPMAGVSIADLRQATKSATQTTRGATTKEETSGQLVRVGSLDAWAAAAGQRSCPACGERMRTEGPGLLCDNGHPGVGYTALDGAYFTRSSEIAESLARKGFRVEKQESGSMYNIWDR